MVHFWLLLQWEHPNLASHMQRGGASVTRTLMQLLLSLLATNASPSASVRLIELALWEPLPTPVSQAHFVHTLVALLLKSSTALLDCPPPRLATTLAETIRVEFTHDADLLHAAARALAATTPRTLQACLDASWCAGRLSLAPYLVPYLEPAEVLNGIGAAAAARTTSSSAASAASTALAAADAANAAAALSSSSSPSSSPFASMLAPTSKCWVVDLRSQAEFDRGHLALTVHLPPEEARSLEARVARIHELLAICREGNCALAVLTAADPTSSVGNGGGSHGGSLSAEEVRTLTHELVRAGCRHCGIVRGGFAAFSPEQRAVRYKPLQAAAIQLSPPSPWQPRRPCVPSDVLPLPPWF